MSCLINYPTAMGDGAVDADGFLVSCCGDWLRPNTWDSTAPCRIVGKIYPAGAAVDMTPPALTEGTLLPHNMASGGTFHFNTSLIPDAVVGVTNQIKVWLQNLDTGEYVADGPVNFIGCVYGDPDCDSPYCLDSMAIDKPAPLEYRVGPDLRAIALIGETSKAWKQGDLKFDGIKLDYSLSLSTPSRAVWEAAGDSEQSPVLRLEVTRSTCGFTATLYLLQLSKRGVEPARRWRSKRFNLARGGALHAIDACCRELDGLIGTHSGGSCSPPALVISEDRVVSVIELRSSLTEPSPKTAWQPPV
jgi:hypothetical protein